MRINLIEHKIERIFDKVYIAGFSPSYQVMKHQLYRSISQKLNNSTIKKVYSYRDKCDLLETMLILYFRCVILYINDSEKSF